MARTKKTLSNLDVKGTKKQVPDVEIFGNGDLFKLISKAFSQKEGWMKSTKGCDLGVGCVIQVTTQQGDNIAEALTYVPGVTIEEEFNTEGICTGRKIVPIVKTSLPWIEKVIAKVKK